MTWVETGSTASPMAFATWASMRGSIWLRSAGYQSRLGDIPLIGASIGGIVGVTNFPTSFVHPSYFDHAPHFDTGGVIGGGGVPIIAHPGEGIFSKEQMAAMGGSSAPRGAVPR